MAVEPSGEGGAAFERRLGEDRCEFRGENRGILRPGLDDDVRCGQEREVIGGAVLQRLLRPGPRRGAGDGNSGQHLR